MRYFFGVLALALMYPIGYFVLNDDPHVQIPSSVDVKNDAIGVFVVNLDRSKDRLIHVMEFVRLLDLPTMRISAVDGNQLTKDDIKEVLNEDRYLTYMGNSPKRGTVGCSLSHIALWKKFLESDFEFALVFEDDIGFDAKNLLMILAKLVHVKDQWDIVNLEPYHHGGPVTVKDLGDDIRLVKYLFEATHTGAYLVNRKAVIKLLEKALPIVMPIDHYYSRSWEFGLKYRGIEPRPVKQTFGVSEIEKGMGVSHIITNKQRSLIRLLYLTQSYVSRFLYNLFS